MGQLSSTPKQQTTMLLERAKSFSLGLKFVTAGNTPVDITGAVVFMKILETPRYGSTVKLTKTAVADGDPVEGFCRIDLQAIDLDLAPKTYLFSIVMHAASGYSGVIVKGEIEIFANGAPESVSLTYPGVNPSQSLTVLLGDNNEVCVTMPSFEYPELLIGGVFTVSPGVEAAASIRGRYPIQILDLTLPQGERGIGLANASIASGRLKFTLTTGQVIDAGALPAHPGTGADLIDDLSDVDTTSSPPVYNDDLRHDGIQWVPGSTVALDGGIPAFAGGITVSGGSPAAAGLGQVFGGSPNGGDPETLLAQRDSPALTGTPTINGVPIATGSGSSVSAINDLSDVDTVTTPPVNDVYLRYNGSQWVPSNTINGGTP